MVSDNTADGISTSFNGTTDHSGSFSNSTALTLDTTDTGCTADSTIFYIVSVIERVVSNDTANITGTFNGCADYRGIINSRIPFSSSSKDSTRIALTNNKCIA